MRDGLYNTIIAASMFSANDVSKDDYGVLARSSNCAIVVNPPSTTDVDMHTFGRDWGITYTFPCEAYIRDTGDPTRIPDDVTKIIDDFIIAVHADETLGSTACAAAVTTINVLRASTGGPLLFDIGGQTWIPVFMTVQGLEVKAKP